jgi:pyruvate-formate lyase-activating enzyme
VHGGRPGGRFGEGEPPRFLRVRFLPYHVYGANKYRLLDRRYDMPDTRGLDMRKRVEELREQLQARTSNLEDLAVHVEG